MKVQASAVTGQERFVVRQDLQSVRGVLRRIRRHVQLIDLSLLGSRKSVKVTRHLDRRHYHRSPIRMPIRVMPASFDGRHAELLHPGDIGILAVTRDVSLTGVGLLHDELIEAEFAVVDFDHLDGCPLTLLVELRWSNTEQSGSYMSGARFVGSVEPLG